MKIKIGTEIGNWKIISDKYKKDNIYWNDCECVCGKIKAVRTWHLNNNKTKGCGCTNTKNRFKAQCIGDLSKSYYTSFRYNRMSKGIEFSENITLQYLWNLFLKQEGKCAISKVDIILNPRWSEQNKGRKTKVFQTASIDRINSSIGYIVGNIQWVHKDINYMKGSLNDTDFINWCKVIAQNN